jgi:putative endonuclease
MEYNMCYVYALQSKSNGRIYVGQTRDINRRLHCHNEGYVKSTYGDRPWKLVAFEKLKSVSQARWRERELKRSLGKRIKWLEQKKLNK